MSDTPTPEAAPTSSASVVIDHNAKVAVSRRPVYLAVAAVVAFVAFTVVWFAVKSKDDYQPGPVAKGFVGFLDEHHVKAEVQDSELKCIDDNSDGIPADFFDNESFDALDGTSADARSEEFGITLLDECLQRPSRVAMLAAGMAEDGSLDAEQADCFAGRIDDYVIGAGGYRVLSEASDDDSQAASDLLGVVFGAMAECGLDLSQLSGSDD